MTCNKVVYYLALFGALTFVNASAARAVRGDNDSYEDEYDLDVMRDQYEEDPRLSQLIIAKRSNPGSSASVDGQDTNNILRNLPPNVLEAVLTAAMKNQAQSNGDGDDCPKAWPRSLCKQPSSFYIWLQELRRKEKERELALDVKKMLTQYVLRSAMLKQQNKQAASAPKS